MAMSDCEKCWETPCVCGHGWQRWLNRLNPNDLIRLIEMAKNQYERLKGKENGR